MARSAAALAFRDGELEARLPDAIALYHVDGRNAPWFRGWEGRKADWAWLERDRLFICELRDPECSGAAAHPASAARSHSDGVLLKLHQVDPPNVFAEKAHNTLERLRSEGVLPTSTDQYAITYIVLIAISDRSFDAMVRQTAAELIKRHLAGLGETAGVVVIDLTAWNALLAPRTIVRTGDASTGDTAVTQAPGPPPASSAGTPSVGG